MRRVFARLSPGLVVAMVALFIALTGTAVATTSALITGNQIKNSSITGLDVKNKSLTPRDFRGSVRGPRGLRGPAGPTGATGATGAKGDKGDPGNPATADGAAVLIGRVVNPGGVGCLTGAGSGLSTSGPCSVDALRDRSGAVPVARFVRNFYASIPAAIGNGSRVMLYRPGTGGILIECTIPTGQTTCTAAGPLAVATGALLSIEVDASGGAALPSSVGFGYELVSSAGAALAAIPSTRPSSVAEAN